MRITANNPLIRTLLLQLAGVAIEPETSEKFRSSAIASIDWRQVLDCVRGWDQDGRKEAFRPVRHYTILHVISRAIHELRNRLPHCFACIKSYCHSPAFRSGVLSAYSHGSAAGCFLDRLIAGFSY